MDPQFKSLLSSVILGFATAIASWGVSKGVIPDGSQGAVASVIANDVMTFGAFGVAAVLAWYKTRSHTPTAQIVAVNKADNGVKVVPAGADAAPVDQPLKGPK